MDKILSIRCNNQILSLFKHIQNFQKSANRTDIINAGIHKALKDNVDWNMISNVHVPIIPSNDIDIPAFIQLRVNANDYEIIAMQIHNHFHLDKIPPAPYVIRLLLTNYLVFLQSMNTQILPPDTKEHILITNEFLTPTDFNSLDSLDLKLNYIYNLLYTLNFSSAVK